MDKWVDGFEIGVLVGGAFVAFFWLLTMHAMNSGV